MAIAKNISRDNSIRRSIHFDFISIINKKIAEEKENAFGISIILITVGTMIASINAAFALDGEVAYFILASSLILTTITNVAAISQQPFKIMVWSFIINVLVSIILIIYQISESLIFF